MAKRRYAIVGVGSRSRMYFNAVLKEYTDLCDLVAICDNNQGRLELAIRDNGPECGTVPTYLDERFDEMVANEKPEVIIVTTRDSLHDKYIVRGMELGCDIVTEKPMTIDEVKCQRIVDTARQTGRKVRVTFNYRYSPSRTQIKELLMDGIIGRVLSVDFHWLLDTGHGADYFRRWHRNKENSGGLMVHKATHHFDLVNWWISSTPTSVYAAGARNFYTPDTAVRYGLEGRAERCADCAVADKCKFHLDITRGRLKELYRDNEHHDGYFRDRCVFSETIDIEDTMNLVIQYASGAYLTYSLNAFCPKEGYIITFNGTKGRLEFNTLETSYVSGQEGGKVHETVRQSTTIWHCPHFAAPRQIEVRHGTGGHGGGDSPLLDDIFLPEPPADRCLRSADHAEGAWSILTGVAANKSLASGSPIRADELVTGIPECSFTAMPDW